VHAHICLCSAIVYVQQQHLELAALRTTSTTSSTTSSSVFIQDSILGRIMRFIGKRTASRAACAVVCKRWNTFAAPYSRTSRMPQLAQSTATAVADTAAAAATLRSSAADSQPVAESTNHTTEAAAAAAAAADSVKGKGSAKNKPKTKASKQRKRNGSSK
jgi:hypothetical protein